MVRARNGCGLQALVLVGTCVLAARMAAAENYKSVTALKDAMYERMDYSRACYKLLNATGETGCEAPNKELITAPLIHYADLERFLTGKKIVVVPSVKFDGFISQYLMTPVLKEHVVGVLVDPADRPTTESVALPFPGAEYAPYSAPGYVWNPAGSGLSRQYIGIPVYMMTEAMANESNWRATYNAKFSFKAGKHVAQMYLPMDATTNSSTCIIEGRCQPVGGYSVWSALPSLVDPTYNTTNSSRPITLVVTQYDSNSFFHDLTKAATTALSGVMAMLGAVEILARYGNASTYSRQLAFAALTAEAFDYTGSRRFLFEMESKSAFTQGLSMDLIDQVVEVGQVATAWDKASNATTLYVHTQGGAAYGDATALVSAAKSAATQITDVQVAVRSASASNPGIPPSSLMSFLRVKPSVKGMVLADFDSAFRTPYYQSEFDDGSNFTVQAVVDAAIVLARTLHQLASGPSTPALLVNRTEVVATLNDMALCMVLDQPGMGCDLVSSLMPVDRDYFGADGTTSAAYKGYPSVFGYVDPDPKRSSYKNNMARFIFNWLGNTTALPLPANGTNVTSTGSREGAWCDTDPKSDQKCPWPLACIGWRYGTDAAAGGLGVCRNTSANYVPSYTTSAVWYNNYGWDWNLTVAANFTTQYGWPADPGWTESNWPTRTPTLTVFQQETRTTEVAILVSGLLLSLATGVVSWLGIAVFEQRLKQQ